MHMKEIYQIALTRLYQGQCNSDDYYLLRGLIEESELLQRENKALEDDNYQKCLLNEELAKENKALKSENLGLKSTNRRMERQLDKYFRSVTRLK